MQGICFNGPCGYEPKVIEVLDECFGRANSLLKVKHLYSRMADKIKNSE
jgi:hypothetical protein